MSTKDKAYWCLARRSVALRGVRILGRLNKCIQAFLICRDMMSKAHKDGVIESLGFVICLRMVHCYCEVFSTEKGAHCSEKFSYKFSTIVGEDLRWDAVRDVPIIKVDACNVGCCCLGCCNSLSQFGVSVDNDKCVLATMCCYGEWFQDNYCDIVQ